MKTSPIKCRYLSLAAVARRARLALIFPSCILVAGFAGVLPAAGQEIEQRVRVAAISFVPQKLDLAGNSNRLEDAFRRAAAGGAKIAVAPEGALDGYAVNQVLAGEVPVSRLAEAAIPLNHSLIRRFQHLAKELDPCLVFGFSERIAAEIYNTAVFIDNVGRISGKYHKMLFAEGYHDGWWFNRIGAHNRAFDTPFGRCGVLICNDRWNPKLARIPALDGAQFLVIPSFGSRGRSQDEAVLGRGRENGLPVVAANVGVGLIASDGEVVAVSREEEAVVFGEISIPGPIPVQAKERDEEEQAFLVWRGDEMKRRYESKHHRFVPSH